MHRVLKAAKAAKAIAFLSLIGLISFLLVEMTIRATGRAAHLYTEPCFEWSPNRSYWRYRPWFEGRVLGPTLVRIGPNRNRLHKSAVHNSPDVTVMVVGDSVTFGQAVPAEETFVARLEGGVRAKGHDIEVLNFGVQGHNGAMMLAHLKDLLATRSPDVVILAFLSDDFNPRRANNEVDRFGYLTKTTFGRSSWGWDLVRASLRRSHAVLLAKQSLLSVRARSATRTGIRSEIGSGISDRELEEFRDLVSQFRRKTEGLLRIVICLDMEETSLSRQVARFMAESMPDLSYIHAPKLLDKLPLSGLRVPRDGHPNSRAHEIYASLIMPQLMRELESHVASESLVD